MASQQHLQRKDRTTQREIEADNVLASQAEKEKLQIAKEAAEAEERQLHTAKEAAEAEQQKLEAEERCLHDVKEVVEVDKANQFAILEQQAELEKLDRDREFQLKVKNAKIESILLKN